MFFDAIIKFIESKAPGQSSEIKGKEALLVPPDNWTKVSTLIKNDGSVIVNANIYCDDSGTTSDNYGSFLISCYEDDLINISHILMAIAPF